MGKNNVSVWADGYGRWHAVVADTPKGLDNAIDAITAELFDRAPRSARKEELFEYVSLNIVSTPENVEPGFVHFMEYALED